MSVIYDAMLLVNLREDEAIDAVNRALYGRDTACHQQFNKIDMDGAGGSKAFCTYVYAAAFNHLLPSDVEKAIAAAPWRHPDWVLYVYDPGDYYLGDEYGDSPGFQAKTITQLRAESEGGDAA
jgi:hypothetical protein